MSFAGSIRAKYPSSSNLHAASLVSISAHSIPDPETPRATESEIVVTTTMGEATMNLICGGLGTGMLSLPWTMAGSSLIPGIATILGVIAINVCTIIVLVEAAEKHQAFDLGAVLEKLPGRLGTYMQALTNFAIWFSMIMTLIGYIDAIHDSALPLVKGNDFLTDSRLPLTCIAAAVVLPLCFLDQKYLTFTSTLAIIANVNLLCLILYLFGSRAASHDLGDHLCLFGFSRGNLTMVSTATNSIIVQMCILPMYEVLENRSPQKFTKVLLISFGGLCTLLCGFGGLAYLAVGSAVQGNVLLNLPTNAWSNISQAGVIMVVLAVYPIFLLPMVAPLRTLDLTWFLKRGNLESRLIDMSNDDRDQMTKRACQRRRLFVNVLTVVIVLVSLLGSWVLTDLGPLNAINGAICVGVFTSFGPGLAGLFLLDRKSFLWRASMGLLLVFGICAMALGFIFKDNFDADLWKNCMWRIS